LSATGLRIRRYEPEDKEAVWRLHNEALDGVGAHLGNGGWDNDLHKIGGAYLEAGGEFLVGVLDGRIVAMGALRRISHEEAEIKRVRVEPALQGRGYGQALLEALHRRAAGLGYSTLRLDTTVHQRAARSLYEASGYREARRGRIGPFDCVFYERKAVV
jgi:ribosomal protein S18 acetylase RimI-like enzyme